MNTGPSYKSVPQISNNFWPVYDGGGDFSLRRDEPGAELGEVEVTPDHL